MERWSVHGVCSATISGLDSSKGGKRGVRFLSEDAGGRSTAMRSTVGFLLDGDARTRVLLAGLSVLVSSLTRSGVVSQDDSVASRFLFFEVPWELRCLAAASTSPSNSMRVSNTEDELGFTDSSRLRTVAMSTSVSSLVIVQKEVACHGEAYTFDRSDPPMIVFLSSGCASCYHFDHMGQQDDKSPSVQGCDDRRRASRPTTTGSRANERFSLIVRVTPCVHEF